MVRGSSSLRANFVDGILTGFWSSRLGVSSLPYSGRSADGKLKRGRNAAIAGSRVSVPEIFVRFQARVYPYERIVKAHIRIRSGCYRYLVWREGRRLHEFYLGKVKQLCPTEGQPAASARDPRAPARSGDVCRVQKRAVRRGP